MHATTDIKPTYDKVRAYLNENDIPFTIEPELRHINLEGDQSYLKLSDSVRFALGQAIVHRERAEYFKRYNNDVELWHGLAEIYRHVATDHCSGGLISELFKVYHLESTIDSLLLFDALTGYSIDAFAAFTEKEAIAIISKTPYVETPYTLKEVLAVANIVNHHGDSVVPLLKRNTLVTYLPTWLTHKNATAKEPKVIINTQSRTEEGLEQDNRIMVRFGYQHVAFLAMHGIWYGLRRINWQNYKWKSLLRELNIK